MATEVKVKKWGNSMGIILPRELVEKNKLEENDKIIIEVVKKADLRHLFGSLKRKTNDKTRITGQEFKDIVREGWKK